MPHTHTEPIAASERANPFSEQASSSDQQLTLARSDAYDLFAVRVGVVVMVVFCI